MTIMFILIILIWSGVGVYDALDNGRKPQEPIQYFLSGPVFWVIALGKYLYNNRKKII
jgi:hypothetical protein